MRRTRAQATCETRSSLLRVAQGPALIGSIMSPASLPSRQPDLFANDALHHGTASSRLPADRASALAVHALGVHARPDLPPPFVTVSAAPPDRGARTRPLLSRLERAVQARVPQCRDAGMPTRQAAGSRKPVARAVRAAMAQVHAVVDCRSPLMLGSLRALPPHALESGRANGVGADAAVALRVPLLGQLRIQGLQAIGDRKPAAGAERARRAPASSIGYRGVPLVVGSLRALPPDFTGDARCYFGGPEGPVASGVPLLGKSRKLLRQRVGARDGPVTAERAAFALRRRQVPLMPPVSRATPPDSPIGTGCDVPWRQLAVLSGMPFGGELGIDLGQRVCRRNAVCRAERAAKPSAHALRRTRQPLMVGSLRALPPIVPPRPGPHVARTLLTILGRVPLARHMRRVERQGVLAVWSDLTAVAVRAASASRTRARRALPLVSRVTRAAPPILVTGTRSNLRWLQHAVLFRVPFPRQPWANDGERPVQRNRGPARHQCANLRGASATGNRCSHFEYTSYGELALPGSPAQRFGCERFQALHALRAFLQLEQRR
jgi:hypothetical protein